MEFILLKVLPAIEDSDTNSLPDLSEANVSLNGKSEARGQCQVFKGQLIEWCEHRTFPKFRTNCLPYDKVISKMLSPTSLYLIYEW